MHRSVQNAWIKVAVFMVLALAMVSCDGLFQSEEDCEKQLVQNQPFVVQVKANNIVFDENVGSGGAYVIVKEISIPQSSFLAEGKAQMCKPPTKIQLNRATNTNGLNDQSIEMSIGGVPCGKVMLRWEDFISNITVELVDGDFSVVIGDSIPIGATSESVVLIQGETLIESASAVMVAHPELLEDDLIMRVTIRTPIQWSAEDTCSPGCRLDGDSSNCFEQPITLNYAFLLSE